MYARTQVRHTCTYTMHATHARVRYVREQLACMRACEVCMCGLQACVVGMHVCSILIFNFTPAPTFECTTHVMQIRTHAMHDTLSYTQKNTLKRAPGHTHTHMRARKIRFREPSIPRENTVITGISILKRWLKVRYLGCKSMKLKKSNGVSESMIWISKSSIGPRGSRVLHFLRSFCYPRRFFAIFTRSKTWRKKCYESAYS